MGTKYINRLGKKISKEEWQTLQADPSYRIVKRFDNKRVQVDILWSGIVKEPVASQLSEFWPVFILKVRNYREEGRLVVQIDPVENGRTFEKEEQAIRAYQEFLIKWTECDHDERGFHEFGNILKPPAPPDKNKPETEPDMLGSEGAW